MECTMKKPFDDIIHINNDLEDVYVVTDSDIDTDNINKGKYSLLKNVNSYTKKIFDKILICSCLTFSSIICFSILFILFVSLLYLF